MKKTILFCMTFAVIVYAFTAKAESVAITASDNAYAFMNAPDAVQSVASNVQIKNYGADSYSRIAYLRFDVSSLSEAKTVENAELLLNFSGVGSGTDTIYVYALNNGVATETSWSSTNLTWNTRPDATGFVPNSKTSGVLERQAVSSTGEVTFDLTYDLRALLDADTNGEITLVLSALGGDILSFSALGTANEPVLNVSYDGSPRISMTALDNAVVKGDDSQQDESQVLVAKYSGAPEYLRYSYLRFDISDNSIMENAFSATINLQVVDPGVLDAGSVVYTLYALNDVAASSNPMVGEAAWDANMTWSIRPDGIDGYPGNLYGTAVATFSGAVSGGIARFDITDELPGLVAADSNGEITFLIASTANQGQTTFASLSNTSGFAVPTLTLNADEIIYDFIQDSFTPVIEYTATDAISTWYSDSWATPVATIDGSTYFTYVRDDLQCVVGKVTGTNVTELLLESGYVFDDDGHNEPSIAVDKAGYIHVLGNMHNNELRYWRSNVPYSIADGFSRDFGAVEGTFSYYGFRKDRNDELYFVARASPTDDPFGATVRRGLGLYRYDTGSRSWTALGSPPPGGQYPLICWDSNGVDSGTYQMYKADVKFDVNNRMHFCTTINQDGSSNTWNYAIYAWSDDGGETFMKADGTVLDLPVYIDDGSHQGDVIDGYDNAMMDEHADLFLDEMCRPAVTYEIEGTHWIRYWDGSAWQPRSLLSANTRPFNMTDPFGVHTFSGNSKFIRFTQFDGPRVSLSISLSKAMMRWDTDALRDSGVYRGVIWDNNVWQIVRLDNPNAPVLRNPLSDFQRWQLAYFGATSGDGDPDADPDQDQMSNRDEFLAGTNPNNRESRLRISSAVLEGAGMSFTWEAAGPRTTVLQVSTNLVTDSFRDVGTPVVIQTAGDTTCTGTATNNATDRNMFYRVRVIP